MKMEAALLGRYTFADIHAAQEGGWHTGAADFRFILAIAGLLVGVRTLFYRLVRGFIATLGKVIGCSWNSNLPLKGFGCDNAQNSNSAWASGSKGEG